MPIRFAYYNPTNLSQHHNNSNQQQQKNAPAILDSEIKSIYDSLSAFSEPIHPRPKINTNFLENLRIKFLDTRGINDDELKALESNIAKQLQVMDGYENSSISVQEAEKGMVLVTEAEFSQLIYANVISIFFFFFHLQCMPTDKFMTMCY